MRALLAVLLAVAVLAAANVLNNRLAPGAYVVTCICAATALLLLARWDGCTWSDLGLGRDSIRRGLAWAGVAALIVLVVYTVAALLPLVRTVFEDDRAGGANVPRTLWNVLVRIPLGTVLLEETAFRGVLYAMLARRYGVAKAIAASSLAFGFWHILPSWNLASRNAAVEALVGNGPAAPLLVLT
ncbi:CPBP family intramembrane glutamic endopeptidase, partial [Actinomadura adrarensis]